MDKFINHFSWIFLFGFLTLILNFYYGSIKEKICLLSTRLFKSPLFIHYFFFLGTVVHELSHALVSFLLRAKIKKIVPFYPRKSGKSYILGYVEHEKVDLFRSSLIGIAPIIGCSLFTYFTFLLAAGEVSKFFTPINFSMLLNALDNIFLNLFNFNNFNNLNDFNDSIILYLNLNWKTFFFIYTIFACSIAGEPSSQDTKPVRSLIYYMLGISFILWVIFIVNNSFPGINILIDLINIILLIAESMSSFFMSLSFILFFQVIILSVIHAILFLIFKNLNN